MADDSVLSHPEILAHERLVDILSSRGIARTELLGKEKDALVELFYRFVVPLPQRATNMRRANRLKKNLHPVKVAESTDLERKDYNRGVKRKQANFEMKQTIVTNVSNFLHQPSVHSPTTECTKNIIKLSMNCAPQTPAKPVKLSRKWLTTDQKTQNDSSTQSKINIHKKDPSRIAVSQSTNSEDSTSSDTQVDSEEKEHRTLKKFKRNTVTWP